MITTNELSKMTLANIRRKLADDGYPSTMEVAVAVRRAAGAEVAMPAKEQAMEEESAGD